MSNKVFKNLAFSVLGLLMILSISVEAKKKKNKGAQGPDTYYKETPIFLAAPDSRKEVGGEIRNFGPVGLGLEFIKPNFTIKIVKVDKGSPADATGQLKPGQIIESINGKVLKDRDPRMILGDLISESEAGDGKMRLKIKGKGTVVVQLEPMGSYSKTWPLNCPKSDKIVRKLADILAKQDKPRWGSILFLLSTGEDKDLEVVKKWMKNPQPMLFNWERGCEGIAYCEYYLRTGDKSVLPFIKKEADILKKNMWRGSWNARNSPARYGYGVLNAAGVHCTTFLAMAKLCGVDVDKYTFDTAFKQFYRFAGHGNVAYGVSPPEGGFRDNGKHSGLALTMAAATLLSPEGEKSNYAKARDNSAMKAFYATSWFRQAHTGGGIGEVWHHLAMNQIREKRPKPYRSYFDTRKWLMELSRRPDGSIGIGGQLYIAKNSGYDKSATEHHQSHGTIFALTYTLPRNKLQLFGAPRSKYAVYDKSLPKRPWGNERDDLFLESGPIPGSSLTMKDLENEKVEKDASAPVGSRVKLPNVTDETLLRYLHHPEIGLRITAMRSVCAKGRTDLVISLLRSDDSRLRHLGLLALSGPFKGAPIQNKTPEMFSLTEKILEDKNESWWVTQEALKALHVSGTPEMVARHKDRIVELSRIDSQYLRQNAVDALIKICTDPKYYKSLMPIIARELSVKNIRRLAPAAAKAKPEVKKYMETVLKEAFSEVPDIMKFPGGAVSVDGSDVKRSQIAQVMDVLPSGSEYIIKRPKITSAYIRSGKKSDMYHFDGQFKTNPKLVGVWSKIVSGIDKNYPAPTVEKSIDLWYKSMTQKRPLRVKTNKLQYGIRLRPDGTVAIINLLRRSMGSYVWSRDLLIGKYADEALKIKPYSIEGFDFLIVENALKSIGEVTRSEEGGAEAPGEFKVGLGMDWKPMHNIFIKMPEGAVEDMKKKAKVKKKTKKAEKKKKKNS